MKKIIIGALLCILLLACLISCAKSREGKNVTLLIDNQTNMDGINAMLDAIKEKYGITTTIDLRPGGAEGDNVVRTRLATDDMADLCFYNTGSLFQALNPPQNFINITDEPFMKNVLDSFKQTVSVDGRVYGIPVGTAMGGGWFYNKKIYAELGLKVPKTWAELMANCEKIKSAGKVAVIGSYKDSWTAQLILLADYYNVQAEYPDFAEDYTAHKAGFADTPIALRGFEKLQEVYKKGYMDKDLLATTYEVALKKLLNEDGAHYPMLTFCLGNMSNMAPDKMSDIGFFAQPGDIADKNGLTVWTGGGIYLSKKSKNVAAIKKIAEFFVSPEGLALYMAAQKPEGPFLVKDINLPDDIYSAVKDLLPYFNSGKTAPALEFISPIKGPNLPQICVEAGTAIKTPIECAKAYDKDVEKQAKQLGIAGW